jgi:hypothetical protein
MTELLNVPAAEQIEQSSRGRGFAALPLLVRRRRSLLLCWLFPFRQRFLFGRRFIFFTAAFFLGDFFFFADALFFTAVRFLPARVFFCVGTGPVAEGVCAGTPPGGGVGMMNTRNVHIADGG